MSSIRVRIMWLKRLIHIKPIKRSQNTVEIVECNYGCSCIVIFADELEDMKKQRRAEKTKQGQDSQEVGQTLVFFNLESVSAQTR